MLPNETVLQSEEICLPPALALVSCSAYSSALKMDEIYSSETSIDFQRITRRYIPEDSTVHNYRFENLKSHMLYILVADIILK
jgi:hypothetical protein